MFCSVAARGKRGGLVWQYHSRCQRQRLQHRQRLQFAGSDLSEQLLCESVAPTARQGMKSHLHTVWLTCFQISCADFVALRNISYTCILRNEHKLI